MCVCSENSYNRLFFSSQSVPYGEGPLYVHMYTEEPLYSGHLGTEDQFVTKRFTLIRGYFMQIAMIYLGPLQQSLMERFLLLGEFVIRGSTVCMYNVHMCSFGGWAAIIWRCTLCVLCFLTHVYRDSMAVGLHPCLTCKWEESYEEWSLSWETSRLAVYLL